MAKKVAFLGMFSTLALILGWLESLLPVVPFAPGVKIGLANLVSLLVLYRFGWKEAACVNMLRIGLSSALFGNIALLLYSLAGAILSLITMCLLKKTDKFSIVGISVAGAVMHNLGQIIVAAFLMENGVILYYLPILAVSGVIAGVLVGLASAFLHKHLPKEIG
ncbi:MAG: Gx transporter family protein [Lachnospiraceae bacterium]|nr:Gx transporter family protein [Lachnospiraceae bacterium]MBP3507249.1 Gx transporter family protein [Lachnospiraceae bacterium]